MRRYNICLSEEQTPIKISPPGLLTWRLCLWWRWWVGSEEIICSSHMKDLVSTTQKTFLYYLILTLIWRLTTWRSRSSSELSSSVPARRTTLSTSPPRTSQTRWWASWGSTSSCGSPSCLWAADPSSPRSTPPTCWRGSWWTGWTLRKDRMMSYTWAQVRKEWGVIGRESEETLKEKDGFVEMLVNI